MCILFDLLSTHVYCNANASHGAHLLKHINSTCFIGHFQQVLALHLGVSQFTPMLTLKMQQE